MRPVRSRADHAGSALALPLPDASFDRAYSHNVVMNIADKAAVYCEAFRVLKPADGWCWRNQCRAERAGRVLPRGLGIGAGEQFPRHP